MVQEGDCPCLLRYIALVSLQVAAPSMGEKSNMLDTRALLK